MLVPGVLYVAWYGWSRLVTSAQPLDNPIRLHNLAQVPSTIVSVGAAGLSAVAGVFGSSGVGEDVSFNLSAGYVLLGLLVIAVVWRVRSGPRLEREIWVPIALALSFWGLVGMAASPDRPPEASRATREASGWNTDDPVPTIAAASNRTAKLVAYARSNRPKKVAAMPMASA